MEINEVVKDIFGPDLFLESSGKSSTENSSTLRYFFQSAHASCQWYTLIYIHIYISESLTA